MIAIFSVCFRVLFVACVIFLCLVGWLWAVNQYLNANTPRFESISKFAYVSSNWFRETFSGAPKKMEKQMSADIQDRACVRAMIKQHFNVYLDSQLGDQIVSADRLSIGNTIILNPSEMSLLKKGGGSWLTWKFGHDLFFSNNLDELWLKQGRGPIKKILTGLVEMAPIKDGDFYYSISRQFDKSGLIAKTVITKFDDTGEILESVWLEKLFDEQGFGYLLFGTTNELRAGSLGTSSFSIFKGTSNGSFEYGDILIVLSNLGSLAVLSGELDAVKIIERGNWSSSKSIVMTLADGTIVTGDYGSGYDHGSKVRNLPRVWTRNLKTQKASEVVIHSYSEGKDCDDLGGYLPFVLESNQNIRFIVDLSYWQ